MSVMYEMERKVTKIGNSLGVTIPADVLKKIDVVQGDEITLDLREGEIILRKSRKIHLPNGISSDFFEILSQTMEQFDETIKGLRDK